MQIAADGVTIDLTVTEVLNLGKKRLEDHLRSKGAERGVADAAQAAIDGASNRRRAAETLRKKGIDASEDDSDVLKRVSWRFPTD